MLNQFLFRKHLEEDETLQRIVHKHWLLGIKSLFWPTLFFIGTWALLYFIHSRAMFLAVSFVSIAILVWWIRDFFDYYLDAWLVTDHGIIDVEWHGWFHRESSRILYSDVQGVSYEINGIVGTLFRYGTITVEKISTGAAVSLECVKNPRSIETEILRNMEHYLHSKNMKDAKQVQELLATLVAEQIQIREMGGEVNESADGNDEG